MEYNQIKQYFSSATHIYGNITPEDMNLVFVNHYMTVLFNITYIGTNEPIAALSGKEIINLS